MFTFANMLKIQNYQYQFGNKEPMHSINLSANSKAPLLQNCNADRYTFTQKLAYCAIQC